MSRSRPDTGAGSATAIPAVIPYYKDRAALDRCVACLARSTGVAVEIFIRDNSVDNVLFTAAINEGLLKYAFQEQYAYTLIVNQDLYLAPDALSTLLDFMERNAACGIACPLQVSGADESRVTWGGSLQSFPSGRHRAGRAADYTAPAETPWATGACMLIRNRLVREIGIFDKSMRFVCSDVDFSMTARSRGWQIFVVPAARAVHDFGGSTKKGRSPELDLVKAEDFLYFHDKWLSAALYRRLEYDGQAILDTTVAAWLAHLHNILERSEASAKNPAGGSSQRCI